MTEAELMSSVDEANGLDKESDDRMERWESSGLAAETKEKQLISAGQWSITEESTTAAKLLW